MPNDTLEYASPDESNRPHQRWSARYAAFVAVFVILIAGVSFYQSLPETNGQRWRRLSANCDRNLRAIGVQLREYAATHGDRLPDSFVKLLKTQGMQTATFVCPLGPHEAATNAEVFQASAADCGYVYCGDGLSLSTLPSDAVLAYDRIENHDREGVMVLLADGRTEFIRFGWPANRPTTAAVDPEWAKIDEQVRRRVRPVRWPVP